MAQSGDTSGSIDFLASIESSYVDDDERGTIFSYAWGAFVAGPVNGDDASWPFLCHVDRSRPGKFISERLRIIIIYGNLSVTIRPSFLLVRVFPEVCHFSKRYLMGFRPVPCTREGGALESIIHIGLFVFLPLVFYCNCVLVGRGWGRGEFWVSSQCPRESRFGRAELSYSGRKSSLLRHRDEHVSR